MGEGLLTALRRKDGYWMELSERKRGETFRELLDRYQRFVFKVAYSYLRDMHRAEDICQEVFVDLYRSLERLRDYEKLSSWLKVVTRNKCVDWLKRHRGKVISFDEHASVRDGVELAGSGSGMEEIYRDETARNVMGIVNALPAMQRQALVLVHTEQMSYKEIAKMLGTTVSALKSVLFRARKAVRVEMEKLERTGEEAL